MKTEKELVNQLYTHNQEAFREIYAKYYKLVFSKIHEITKDGETSKDLTQDTFIKMWTNIQTLEYNSNFKAWLMKIAKNTALDFVKTKKDVELMEEFQLDSGKFDEKIMLEYQIDLKRILNETEYMVIGLTTVFGMKRREVAEYMGKPLGTILRVYSEALKKIKTFYEAPNE